MTGCQGTLKSLLINRNRVNSNIHLIILKFPFCYSILCCPEFAPQMVGAVVVAPPTVNVSVQVPTVGAVVEGPPMVKDTKSNLNKKRPV
jgi:hypothetical protein